MNKILKTLLSVTFLFFISGCNKQSETNEELRVVISDGVHIINPWLRDMPAGVSNTAGFMTIKNDTGKPLFLEDVSLDWARMGMIHESKVVDGMAKMIHQDQIEINDQLEFQPGGLHIMVMGMKEPLDSTQTYNILLHFVGREPLAVPFEVRQAK